MFFTICYSFIIYRLSICKRIYYFSIFQIYLSKNNNFFLNDRKITVKKDPAFPFPAYLQVGESRIFCYTNPYAGTCNSIKVLDTS